MVDLHNVNLAIDKEIETFEHRLRKLVDEYNCTWTTLRRKDNILQEQQWICNRIGTCVKMREHIERFIESHKSLAD